MNNLLYYENTTSTDKLAAMHFNEVINDKVSYKILYNIKVY